MDGAFQLTIRNDLAEVTRVATLVAPYLERWEVDAATAYRVQLVLEEVLSNVVRHAYADHGEHEIQVDVAVDGGAVEIRVRDDGGPFDLRTAPKVDVGASLDERQVGGLGIHLVRSCARQIEYRRAGERNHLRIRI